MWRADASRDQSCQYVETRYRFNGGHLPRCSVERAQVWIVNNSYFTRSSVMGDDDVWQIEALRKTNLIEARRRGVDAMRILGQEAS